MAVCGGLASSYIVFHFVHLIYGPFFFMNYRRIEANIAFKNKNYEFALAQYRKYLSDITVLQAIVSVNMNRIIMGSMPKEEISNRNNARNDENSKAVADQGSYESACMPTSLRLKTYDTFATFLADEYFLVLLNISTVFYKQFDLKNAIKYAEAAYKIKENDLSCSKLALYHLRNADGAFKFYYDKIQNRPVFAELYKCVNTALSTDIKSYCRNIVNDDIRNPYCGCSALRNYLEISAKMKQSGTQLECAGKTKFSCEKDKLPINGADIAMDQSNVVHTETDNQEEGMSKHGNVPQNEECNDLPLNKGLCNLKVSGVDVHTEIDSVSSLAIDESPHSAQTSVPAIGPLNVRFVFRVLQKGIETYKNAFNVTKIYTKKMYYVFGDTHGNLISTYQHIKKITNNFDPSFSDHLIFNGDFVDRGLHGLELVIFLIMLKLTYPANIHLNRGNHEFSPTNRRFDLFNQIARLYPFHGTFLFNAVNTFFATLPVCTIVNESIFIVHGGLPATDFTIQDIFRLDRFTNSIDANDILTGLMWSDPMEGNGVEPSRRKLGVHFGRNITDRFLRRNNLALIVRSHEYFDGVFRRHHGGKVVTVFSSVNYIGSGNFGVCLAFDGNSNSYRIDCFY